jgi:hypothetical protein
MALLYCEKWNVAGTQNDDAKIDLQSFGLARFSSKLLSLQKHHCLFSDLIAG